MMDTLKLFVILIICTIAALVWAVIEDDKDERGGR